MQSIKCTVTFVCISLTQWVTDTNAVLPITSLRPTKLTLVAFVISTIALHFTCWCISHVGASHLHQLHTGEPPKVQSTAEGGARARDIWALGTDA